ncbi:MAG: hypothetical protein CSA42_04630 [Gammaproteobacteria bacterium]|nr:MAG: hypothetical protein CSA42_04630 [Gammaproteobacteria bacterium]
MNTKSANKKSVQFKLLALSTLIASSMAITACGAKDNPEDSTENSKKEPIQTTESMADSEKPDVIQAEEVPTDAQIAAEQAALTESDEASEDTTGEQAGEVTQAEAEAAAEALAVADEIK